MLKYIATLLLSSSLLLANPCTLDLTPNTADILCEDESLNLSITYDQGTHAKGKLTQGKLESININGTPSAP